MKNFITLMALLVAFAANAQKTLKTDSVYITGKVSNVDASKPNANTIVLIVNDYASDKQLNFGTTINNDGSYQLSMLKTGTQDVMFKYGDRLVFIIVSPGDHLQMDFDARNFENSVVFKGDNGQTNTDKQAYSKAWGGNTWTRATALQNSEKDSEPEAHKKFLTDRYVKEKVFLDNYLATHKLTPTFINWVKADFKYEYLDNLMRYVWMHAVLNRKQIGDFAPPESYFDFIKQDDLYDVSAAVSSNYGSYVKETGWHFTQKNLGKSYKITDEFALLLKQHKGLWRDIVLSHAMYQLIDGNAVDIVKTNMKMFKSNEGVKGYANSVQLAYNRIYVYTLPAEAKINSLPKSRGDSLFANIIAKYPNKVIYVDFWATWCTPCRAEMPYSKNLYTQMAGKDVVFVYLGVRSEEKLWKSLIAELGLKGEHFFINDNDFTALSQKFQVSGVPHYMLVGKNGKMVNDNAKRPSDNGLKPEIEKLLAAN